MEASNLGTLSRCIITLLHIVCVLQDRCCCASRELCSNYTFYFSLYKHFNSFSLRVLH